MTEVNAHSMLGAPTPPEVDADGRLLGDLACRRCGYSLRGLTPEGLCPECTTPVRRSIYGDLLQFSDPEWVSRVARGAGLLLISIVTQFAMPLIAIMLIPMTFLRTPWAVSALAVPYVIQACAIWLMTTLDPALQEREPIMSVRRVARIGGLCASTALILALSLDPSFGSSLLSSIPPTIVGSSSVRVMAFVAGAGLSIAAIVMLLLFGGQLALRVPDGTLRRQCIRVAWMFMLAATTRAIVKGVSIAIGVPVTGLRGEGWMRAVFGICGLILVVCAVWSIGLLLQFRDRLLTAAKLSRETWARPEAGRPDRE